jgi:acyl-CoA synthetase (AMP-forming)/AMP-acid ligase II
VNIAGILHEAARTSGDRLAIVDPHGTVTFAELDGRVDAVAGQLAAAGVTAGMRVIVLVPMSIALYSIVIALFRLRAAAVFADPSMPRDRLERALKRVHPDAFIGVPRAHLLRLGSAAIRAIPRKMAIAGWAPGATRLWLERPGPGHDIEPCHADTPAILTFTSGSTGEPKAAVRSHGFLVAQHRALAASLALEAGQVVLCTLPIFVFANLASGVTSVIPDADLRAPGAIDPRPVVQQIRSWQVTRTVASPAFLERVAARAAQAGETLPSLRQVYTGGAPVFPRVLDAIAAVAPAAAVTAVYGSTEAEPIAKIERTRISQSDKDAMARGAGLLVGAVVPSIELRILPDRWGTPLGPFREGEWDAQSLATGAAGEIVVAGDHVLRGYLAGAGDEETKVRVGDRVWHRTGDAGRLDPQGRLWLLGRSSARIVDAQGVIYPFAVECAASGVPGLTRSALILRHGRRVLVVEVSGDAAAVKGELERRLAWAHVAEILVVPRIPVDGRHNAKVDYPALERMLGEGE